MELLIMKFSPLPSHFIPLRPKCSPQHPIPKHPQPTFLPQCQRPSFTPIETTGKRIQQEITIAYYQLYSHNNPLGVG
jgi:hypothetical protein